MLIGIACGTLIYWWARELYSAVTAVICAAIWLLDPSVLAFSSVVTADIGAAAFGLLATYTFWQFLRNPSPIRAGVAGVALGLAQASKFTMLVLYPAWTVVTMLAIIRPCTDTEKVPARRLISQFMLLVVTSVILLNAIYQCDGTFTALGAHRFKRGSHNHRNRNVR